MAPRTQLGQLALALAFAGACTELKSAGDHQTLGPSDAGADGRVAGDTAGESVDDDSGRGGAGIGGSAVSENQLPADEAGRGGTSGDRGDADVHANQAGASGRDGAAGSAASSCDAHARCGEGATSCQTEHGALTCVCTTGFTGTGSSACVDIDECASGMTMACGTGVTSCQNTPGGYRCTCDPAYAPTPEGKSCRLRGWGVATSIGLGSGASDNAQAPELAADAAGNAMVVWHQYSGSGSRGIYYNRYVPGQAWKGAGKIEPQMTSSWFPHVAADGAGDAIAIWEEHVQIWNDAKAALESAIQVFASRFSGGAWNVPMRIDSASTIAGGSASIVSNGMGDAFAAWKEPDSSQDAGTQTYSTVYNVFTGGSWGEVHRGYIGGGGMAMDAAGDVLSLSGRPGSTLWSQRYSVKSGSAALPTPIGGTDFASGGSLTDVAIAMNAPGDAIAFWELSGGGHSGSWASHSTDAGGWSTPVSISSTPGTAPLVAIGVSGDATVVWTVWDSNGVSLCANRYNPGSGWGTAGVLSHSDAGEQAASALAMDDAGNAMLAWIQASQVWASRFIAGRGWSSPIRIDSDSVQSMSAPALTLDKAGNAIAVWTCIVGKQGTNVDVCANRFE